RLVCNSEEAIRILRGLPFLAADDPYHPRGGARHQCARRHVLGDDRPGGDHRPVPDPDVSDHRRALGDPDVVADRDGPEALQGRGLAAAPGGIEGMAWIAGEEDVAGEVAAPADGEA